MGVCLSREISGGRIQYLDELRGVAALAVVFQHYAWGFFVKPLGAFLDPGVFGVAVFFCISGFIIPHSVKSNGLQGAKTFVVSRLFRLFPAYWFTLFLAWWFEGPDPKVLLVNITMLQRYFGFADVFGVFWTLQVELCFYAVVTLCCLFGFLGKSKIFPYLALFFGFTALLMGLVRYGLDRKAPLSVGVGLTIMCGTASYYFYKKDGFISKANFLKTMSFAIALLAFAFVFGAQKNWGYNEVPSRFLITDFLALSFFISYTKLQPNLRVFAFIGRISYPLYLIHEFVLDMATRLLGASLNIAILLLVFAVSLLISYLMHIFIERPCIVCGRKVISSYIK